MGVGVCGGRGWCASVPLETWGTRPRLGYARFARPRMRQEKRTAPMRLVAYHAILQVFPACVAVLTAKPSRSVKGRVLVLLVIPLVQRRRQMLTMDHALGAPILHALGARHFMQVTRLDCAPCALMWQSSRASAPTITRLSKTWTGARTSSLRVRPLRPCQHEPFSLTTHKSRATSWECAMQRWPRSPCRPLSFAPFCGMSATR